MKHNFGTFLSVTYNGRKYASPSTLATKLASDMVRRIITNRRNRGLGLRNYWASFYRAKRRILPAIKYRMSMLNP